MPFGGEVRIPKFIPDSVFQDTNKSITVNGIYDLKHFSAHEASVVRTVLAAANRKYPEEYRAIGLANESAAIVYKPRYVLFEIIILQYQESKRPLDQFAVFYAYQTKGARYRNKAILYFEKATPYIKQSVLDQFLYFSQLNVCSSVAKLYEQDHQWDNAIYYARLASNSPGANKPHFVDWIDTLKEKKNRNPKRRQRKMTEEELKLDEEILAAAKYFIK